MMFKSSLIKNLESSVEAKKQLISSSQQLCNFQKAVEVIVKAYRQGGRLYVAGNGGSAADAQHLVAELVGKLAKDRAPLAAESLSTDTSILTALSNDYGYEFVFSRQVTAKVTAKDVFLAITTSGNSSNMLRALEVCVDKGVSSVLFSGFDGGEAAKLATVSVLAPGVTVSQIQEVHLVMEHTLCECIENSLF